jgi:hypothetical protein
MNRYDDDDNFETIMDPIDGKPARVLRDGGRYRVSMTMRDSSPAIRRVTDGSGGTGDGLQRPGFRVRADDARAKQAVLDAYRQRDFEDSQAWRVDAEETWGEAGAQCTVREGGRDEGAPGHLRRVGNRLVCVPDNPGRADSATAQQRVRDAAYATYDNEIREAWRLG